MVKKRCAALAVALAAAGLAGCTEAAKAEKKLADPNVQIKQQATAPEKSGGAAAAPQFTGGN